MSVGPAVWLHRLWVGQQQLARAAGWSLLAAVVSRAANLAALILCARLLSQAEFGQVGIIQSTVGMFAPVASLGLAMTSTKFLAECRDSDPARAGRILSLSLLTAVLAGGLLTAGLIFAAPWIASRGLATPGLAGQLRAASGLLVFGVIESAVMGALAGLSAFSGIARSGAVSGLISIPVIAVAAWKYGATGAIWGLTAAVLLSCALNGLELWGQCRRFAIRPSLDGLKAETEVLFHFSLPSYLSGLVVAPVAWIGSALLVQAPEGLAQMGLFTAADRYRYLLIFVPLAVSRIAVPALSRLHAAGDAAGYRQTLRWNLAVSTAMTAFPVLVCVAAAAPLIALFGPEFRPGWPVLALLALSAVPTVLNTQLGAALLSEGRAWERAAADAVLAATLVAVAWWAVPRWGAAGLAAAFAAAYTAACIGLGALLAMGSRGRR